MSERNFSTMMANVRGRSSRVSKRQFFPVMSIFFSLCISLILCHSNLVAGTAITPSHETGNRHQAHALKTVDAVIDLVTNPENISALTPVTLRFSLKDREGKALSGITVSHERILHVIIVSEDFTVFAHLHPEDFRAVTHEMIQDARFSVNYSFPKAGRYLVALDSAVHDLHFSKQFFIAVTGEPLTAATGTDVSRVKSSGDYVIRLTVPDHIKAGQETTIRYFIEKDSKPLADLEPYLAALMHLAVIKTDLRYFIHAHGEAPDSSPAHPEGHIHGTARKEFGPVIEANITFPVNGMYQMFSEIKHQGKVIVTSFMVKVE